VRTLLDEAGIGTGLFYRLALHQHPAFRDYAVRSLPVSEQLANEVIALPMHPDLSDYEVDRVIDAVRHAVAKTQLRQEQIPGLRAVPAHCVIPARGIHFSEMPPGKGPVLFDGGIGTIGSPLARDERAGRPPASATTSQSHPSSTGSPVGVCPLSCRSPDAP
jgi:hypothetical protein